MVKQYVNTNKARYIARHYAFIGDGSIKAAEATECVFEQDATKGWAFRDRVFQAQDQLRQSGNNSGPLLKTLAGQIGADRAAFNTCFDEGKYRDLVQKEQQIAKQLKVPGTPAFFVDDQAVTGAGGGIPTVEELGKAIDQALARKQGR